MNRAISLPILTMLLTVFAFNSGKATAAEGFISVIDDLPLMAGLVEVKGSALVFSTPQGRIAEVSAKGTSGNAARPKKVVAFYARTLPQLGWLETTPGHFVREDEVLKIEFLTPPAGSTINVLFILSPAQ
mgnify:CR=1 FL=1